MTEKQREQTLLREAEINRRMTALPHFFAYLFKSVTDTPLYERWKAFLAYLRRFRAVALALRILTLFFAILETGALVILGTALFLVILPLAGALMLGILLTARLDTHRANRTMHRLLEGRQVHVLFLPRGSAPFLQAHATSLAARGAAVVVVSPYWISSKGIGGKGFYFTLRKERPNLYLIRKYYFFSMKKRILPQDRTSVVY